MTFLLTKPRGTSDTWELGMGPLTSDPRHSLSYTPVGFGSIQLLTPQPQTPTSQGPPLKLAMTLNSDPCLGEPSPHALGATLRLLTSVL